MKKQDATEEAKQRFKAHLEKLFPTIVSVHSVHDGPNRAQRRQTKFKKSRQFYGRPTNTQKPAFF